MGVSPYSADDYAAGLRKLLPRGRVWPEDPGTGQAQILAALAQAPARLDVNAIALLDGILPARAQALLPDWEETLGLPDPCLGPDPTIAQRQMQAGARFAASGGQSVAYFVGLAAQLGYQVAITVFAPARSGALRAGRALGDEGWAHTWLVTILADPSAASANVFRSGRNRAGDPLGSGSSGRATLECEFRRVAPAHTVLLFAT